MDIPVTGALFIVTGLCFFLLSSELLYAALIVAIPFSATAVMNIGRGTGAKGVSVWLFLAALWMFREMLVGVPVWRRTGWWSTRRTRSSLLLFLMALFCSLSCPLVLNGTSWIPDPLLSSNATIPIGFGVYNLTQTAYVVCGIVLAIIVAVENCTLERLSYTLKLYVGSCAFAAAWGLFELWCNISGHTYPAYIFNTSATESAQGYAEVLSLAEGALGRVSSVAFEPSVLAEELLLAFVVLLISLGLRRPLLGKHLDYAALGVITLALLASTSSTAYAGILAALLLAGAAMLRAGRPWKRYFMLAVMSVLGVILLISTVPLVGELVEMMLITKLDIGSGLERLQSIRFAERDFLQHPLLGAGWHSVPCWDLVFLILANTGLLGLTTFTWFVARIVRALWEPLKNARQAALLVLPAFVLVLILAEAAGLTYAAGYIWLVFGLAMSGVVVASREGLQTKLGDTVSGGGRLGNQPASSY